MIEELVGPRYDQVPLDGVDAKETIIEQLQVMAGLPQTFPTMQFKG